MQTPLGQSERAYYLGYFIIEYSYHRCLILSSLNVTAIIEYYYHRYHCCRLLLSSHITGIIYLMWLSSILSSLF